MMTTKIKMKHVKKGEYFKRTETASVVYVRGDYAREEKKFESSDFNDVNKFIYIKGDKEVFVGFDF